MLTYSYKKCKVLLKKKDYDYEELESIEVFAARFSRLSDLLIQRIFKTIEKVDQDTPGSIRDRINRAEKKGLIRSSEDFQIIRTARNSIAHEYSKEGVKSLFDIALKYTEALTDAVKRVEKFSLKY